MKYVITGRNRLTGKREAVSNPKSREEAEKLLEQARKLSSRLSVFTRLRIEEAAKQARLQFEER
jgi:hypothetical protein